jgi:predicted ATPase/class 3 adenylate cyclase/predicted negative regulator of RcsB-dependent stress response
VADLPTGTVTFLFTDIEGSTKLAQGHPAAWESARQRHHAILRTATEAHQGYIFQIIGDAFCAAFQTAGNGLQAALAAQRALQAEAWGETLIRVRMGLHTGAADTRDGDYHGYLTLAHVQRVMSTAYGGQTLVSNAAAALLSGQLPDGVTLRDIGEHRLKGLLNSEHLWQPVAPDLPQDFPPLQSLNTIPNNLPIQVTSFVGRERELSELQRLLATTRLMTLTGSGGTGKTRLSLQVAADVLDNFKDGVWFVELAPLADPSLLPQTVANVLGVREQPGHPLLATLIDWLRPKQLVLILDNCEHLIDASAKFADAVLHAGQELQILASSREALGIAGETVYRVPSLECPTAVQAAHETVEQLTQYAAVQLFIERATQAQTKFTVTNANAPAVAQICYRLDGIPLAIELAAARVKVFPPEQIATRLDDRFRLLTGGSRTAMPRQQTLRGAIDWSYSLLSEPERILLRRLSVFSGGWFFEAAESVCSEEGIEVFEVLDILSSLVAKSLIVEEDLHGTARYHLLETIRQYARDKLLDSGEGTTVRSRHLAYFVALAEQIEPKLMGADQAEWFTVLETDHDNFRGAIEWATEGDEAMAGLRLGSAVQLFWFTRGYCREGLERLTSALGQAGARERTLARARALNGASSLAWGQAEYTRTRELADEALAIATELNDAIAMVVALSNLSVAASLTGQLTEARRLLERALTLSKGSGRPRDYPRILFRLGAVAMQDRDYETASNYLEEAKTLSAGNSSDGGASVFTLLGHIALHRGNRAEARSLYAEGLTLNQAIGDNAGVMRGISALGGLAAVEGNILLATKLLGAVETLLESTRLPLFSPNQEMYDQSVALVRAGLDKPAFEAAWAEGRALTLVQAAALALEE